MILSREGIKFFMKIGAIFIENFNEDQLNPNSYDVRLGNWFIDVKKDIGGGVGYGKPYYLPDNTVVSIPVGGTLLGMTKERIGSRFCIVPELRAKSTTRRKGITVCDDAGFGDIGYYDFNWTCEFTAHVSKIESVEELVVGKRFAQIVFFLATPTLKPYKGQYSKNDFPINMIPKAYRKDYLYKYEDEIKKIKEQKGYV